LRLHLPQDHPFGVSGGDMLKNRLLPWFGPLTFLGIFFFYPILRILALGLDPSFLSSAPQFLARTSSVLWFTFYQAFLSTVLTLLIGLPLAYLFARYNFPAKSFSAP
jgi:thiamine transport system permease protein